MILKWINWKRNGTYTASQTKTANLNLIRQEEVMCGQNNEYLTMEAGHIETNRKYEVFIAQ